MLMEIVLKLWTLQPIPFYEALKRDGVIHADNSLIEKEFLPAYDWLSEQMRIKIGPPPAGVQYPIWAWHTWEWNRRKPDMRLGFFRNIVPEALMEIEIPDSAVVLSDYENWHYVLSDWFLSDCSSEVEWEADDAWYDVLPPSQQEIEKIKSWERVFDLGPIDIPWKRRGMDIQATFWELRIENVRKVSFHPAKNRRPL